MSQEKKGFMHIDGDEGFQSRSKSVFEGLNTLEPPKEIENSPSREVTRGNRRRPNHVPDHVLHPAKWTKYSLEEDGSEHLGRLNAHEVNKHAALSFLNELKDRRKSVDKDENTAEKDEDMRENFSEKHSFSKPCTTNTESASEENKSLVSQKQGVTVMPEYVVGKTKAQNKRKQLETNNPSSSNQKIRSDIQISHLLQSEQESDSTGQDDGNRGVSESKKVVFTKRKHSKNIRKHRSDEDDDSAINK